MCGRFVQYSAPQVYANQFDLDTLCEAQPRYNLAPTQPVLAIRATDEGKRALVPLRWGLIPAWSKGPDHRYSMINARAETVATKPAYRNAFKHRRCLILTEGFYEWKEEQGKKTPFLIHRQDQAPFAMAGLWEQWREREQREQWRQRGQGEHGQEEEPPTIESCTIIVTEANALVRDIHDRMPVILAPEDFAAWLDLANQGTDELQALLRPASPEQWTMHPVSRQVNNPRNEGPGLLEPIAAA